MISIALDGMGGDHAPRAIVDGAVAAARHLDARLVLVGPTALLEATLDTHRDWRALGIEIVDAPDVVAMGDPPAASLRRKPRASIRVAADLVASRQAAALFSAGNTDVIVCDGFTGNVVLKTSEGLVETVETLLGDELQGTFSSQVGYLLSRRAFRRFRRRLDYSEYGAAPLLGVAGLTLVGHGRSSVKAVRNAIAMAYRFATSDLIDRVEQDIAAATVS